MFLKGSGQIGQHSNIIFLKSRRDGHKEFFRGEENLHSYKLTMTFNNYLTYIGLLEYIDDDYDPQSIVTKAQKDCPAGNY